MYYCNHCGFVSMNENSGWCNNPRCRNYGMALEKLEPQNKSIHMYGLMKEECFMPEVPCNDRLQLAFATVPFQKMSETVYSPHEALKAGTIFPQLNMPWISRIKRR